MHHSKDHAHSITSSARRIAVCRVGKALRASGPV